MTWGRHTLRDLIDGGDEVIATCTGCNLRKPADLPAMRAKYGPSFSLHNYRCKCPTAECYGFVRFLVRRGMRFQALADEQTSRQWKDEASERRTVWLRQRRQTATANCG